MKLLYLVGFALFVGSLPELVMAVRWASAWLDESMSDDAQAALYIIARGLCVAAFGLVFIMATVWFVTGSLGSLNPINAMNDIMNTMAHR